MRIRKIRRWLPCLSRLDCLGLVLGIVIASMSASAVFAETQKRSGKATVYDFEDDVIEGELLRPDASYVGGRRKVKHSSLIKIREDFVPEMLKSAEDI